MLAEVRYAREHDRRGRRGANEVRPGVAAPPTGAATGTRLARRRATPSRCVETGLGTTHETHGDRNVSAPATQAQEDTSSLPRPRRRSEHEAWLMTVERFAWEHFVTLTFAVPTNANRAHKTFMEYLRRLESLGHGPVGAAFLVDRGRSDLVHLHALLVGTATLAKLDMKRLWRHGKQVHIRRYDPNRGAAKYLVAKIAHCDPEPVELVFTDVSKLRRRRRARHPRRTA